MKAREPEYGIWMDSISSISLLPYAPSLQARTACDITISNATTVINIKKLICYTIFIVIFWRCFFQGLLLEGAGISLEDLRRVSRWQGRVVNPKLASTTAAELVAAIDTRRRKAAKRMHAAEARHKFHPMQRISNPVMLF